MSLSAVAMDGGLVDLLATALPGVEATELQIIIDKDGGTQISGLAKQMVRTVDEARHMLNRAFTVSADKSATSHFNLLI